MIDSKDEWTRRKGGTVEKSDYNNVSCCVTKTNLGLMLFLSICNTIFYSTVYQKKLTDTYGEFTTEASAASITLDLLLSSSYIWKAFMKFDMGPKFFDTTAWRLVRRLLPP